MKPKTKFQKRKKKGFTLIELLAVIVILAIVLAITIPAVAGIIENSKKEAFKTSLSNAARKIKYNISEGGVSSGLLENLSLQSNTLSGEWTYDYNTGQITIKKYSSDNSTGISLTSDVIIKDLTTSIMTKSQDTSGANLPLLFTGMIPVKWNGTNWVVADTTQEWYNYGNGNWANSILVSSTNRTNYNTSGYVVNESDVLAYLVWIPRYKYKLWNANDGSSNEQPIDIVFEKTSTSKSNGGSADIGGTTGVNGQYLTHPAFTFGNSELSGFWVSKFEVTNTTAQIQAKPGVTSLRNQSLSSLFYSMRNMELYNNVYGLSQPSASAVATGTDGIISNDNNNVDTHMMKNMEWGATYYLSHSKYGRCIAQGASCEVSINSSSSYYTGGNTGNSYTTNTNQSTTNNIYGIYDMSGNANEYVMGNILTPLSQFFSNNSGFSAAPNSKYYNIYATDISSSTTHNRGLLGDGTKETLKTYGSTTGGWYSDYSGFPYVMSGGWFVRGGMYNSTTNAGLTYFCGNSGMDIPMNVTSSRLVLSAS